MLQLDEQLYERIGEFLGQAITGMHMALYRAQSIPISDRIDMKMLCLIRYLNGCWHDLVTNNDEFVDKSIRGIIEFIPNESPLCLFHILLGISEMALNQDNPMNHIGISGSEELHVPSNIEYLNVLRSALTVYYRDVTKKIARDVFQSRLDHDCSGPKISDIHEQDPSPIWSFESS